MELTLSEVPFHQQQSRLLVLGVREHESVRSQEWMALDTALDGALDQVSKRHYFKGKPGEKRTATTSTHSLL